jgi:hypothetical protein
MPTNRFEQIPPRQVILRDFSPEGSSAKHSDCRGGERIRSTLDPSQAQDDTCYRMGSSSDFQQFKIDRHANHRIDTHDVQPIDLFLGPDSTGHNQPFRGHTA